MFDPRINFGNRDLMARHALHKLQVGTPDSIRVWESFCQLSIEKFRELSVPVALSFLVQKANQDSTVSASLTILDSVETKMHFT